MVTTQGHIRKRPFQPSITSYFSASNPGNTFSPRPVSSPPLPEETQASLLSVGMRVRKSVPEGYKTHKTALFSPQPYTIPTPPSSLPSVPSSSSSARELQPFCGLHKIGGLSSQPEQNYLSPSSSQFYNQSSSSLPPLSTSSTLNSTSSSFPDPSPETYALPLSKPTKKRSLADEAEDFNSDQENQMDAIFDSEFDDFPKEAVVPSTPATRVFAKPRRKAAIAAGRSIREGEVVMGEGGGGDFEDAEFLVPRDGEGMDLE